MEFGSRRIAVVISGDEKGNVSLFPYQVSIMAMAMVEAGLITSSNDASQMIALTTDGKYSRDIFYREGSSLKKAAPLFPTDYLITTCSHGFKSSTVPLFSSHLFSLKKNFTAAHRDVHSPIFLSSVLSYIRKNVYSSDSLENIDDDNNGPSFRDLHMLSDFELLASIYALDILSSRDLVLLKDLVVDHNETSCLLENSDGWKSLLALMFTDDHFHITDEDEEWSCSFCTLLNSSACDHCDACGLPKTQ